MFIHGSCIAREQAGLIFIGPSGSGKSDLAMRLIARGFILVADDQVSFEKGIARPPPSLAGLLEVRGLGVLRLPYLAEVRAVLVIELGAIEPRLPAPVRHSDLDLPLLRLDAALPSAPERVILALDCALGRVEQIAGAFTS